MVIPCDIPQFRKWLSMFMGKCWWTPEFEATSHRKPRTWCRTMLFHLPTSFHVHRNWALNMWYTYPYFHWLIIVSPKNIDDVGKYHGNTLFPDKPNSMCERHTWGSHLWGKLVGPPSSDAESPADRDRSPWKTSRKRVPRAVQSWHSWF